MIESTKELLRAGSVISFDYPAANYRGIRPRLEHRRLRVDSIRNLAENPLEEITLEWEPRLLRGSVLVTGLDLDKGEQRSFYLESMRDLQPCEAVDLSPHVVELLEADSSPEAIYTGPVDACLVAVREWLREPLGMAVSVRRAG